MTISDIPSQDDQSDGVGVPPTSPEAHRSATWTDIFGEPIHVYTRKQAIDDGYLIDAGEIAMQAGFRCPVAISRSAWEDCVAWTEDDSRRQIYQDEVGRLWDVLWMASMAARRADGERLSFRLYRIPRGGRSVRPRLVALTLTIGPGDHGEPVITILAADED